MAAAEEANVEAVAAEVDEATDVPMVADKSVAEGKTPMEADKSEEEEVRAPKAGPKEKKPRAARHAAPAHPPYFQMIKEAMLAAEDKGGLSLYAIAKRMEERYKSVLPANFRKTLLLQLKNSVAKGKLVKVKGSFRLSESGKKHTATKKRAVAGKDKKPKAPAAAAPPNRPKGQTHTENKKRKVPAASRSASKARAEVTNSPKAVLKKPRKKAASKPKQPKSIKSPAGRRARRASAA